MQIQMTKYGPNDTKKIKKKQVSLMIHSCTLCTPSDMDFQKVFDAQSNFGKIKITKNLLT